MSKQSFTTPKGELRWAFISGQGRKNLNNENEYTIAVVVPKAEAQKAIDEIEAFWEANKPKGAKAPKSTGYKIDEATGNVSFVLKTKTAYADGKAKTVRIYNSKAQQITLPDDQKIGNGSRGRASGIMAIYDGGPAARGVTMYLDGVQLTKFVAYSGGDSGFTADDDDEDDEFNGFSESPAFAADELI